MTKQVCGELGHGWRNAGLDVPDSGPLSGSLVTVKVCVRCSAEQRRTYKGRK